MTPFIQASIPSVEARPITDPHPRDAVELHIRHKAIFLALVADKIDSMRHQSGVLGRPLAIQPQLIFCLTHSGDSRLGESEPAFQAIALPVSRPV